MILLIVLAILVLIAVVFFAVVDRKKEKFTELPPVPQLRNSGTYDVLAWQLGD